MLFLLFVSLFSLNVRALKNEKPNIVFVLADDFGYNDIGYHAAQQKSAMATPFLDSLAKSSVRLENYYVQPICTPSRSQLLTGRYQIHTGLQHGIITHMQPNAVPTDNILLPEQLRQCGYDTHMIGKWHLGFYKQEFLPWNRGFNSYFGYLTGAEDYFTHQSCAKVNVNQTYCGYDIRSDKGPTNSSYGHYSTNIFTKKAIDIIYNTDPLKPMFLYLALQSVHAPLEVPEMYVKPFSYVKDRERRLYLGMVLAMDEAIRNITEHLKLAGKWENTIFIFSTDNGGQKLEGGNNWPLRGNKGTLWEGGIKGCGFVHLPNGYNQHVNHQLIHVSDWYPTILAASSCSLINGTQPLDGVNQFETISANTKSARSEFLINIDDFSSKKHNGTYRMGFDISSHSGIRYGDWKLITSETQFAGWYKPPEWNNNGTSTQTTDLPFKKDQPQLHLFNIALDPYERINLVDVYPNIVDHLLLRLAQYNKTAVPVRYPPNDLKADPSLHGGFWGPWVK